MAKIAVYEFKASQIRFRERIRGTITYPRDAKLIHIGAGPPKGNLMVWVEESSIHRVVKDDAVHEYLILVAGDEIPPGFEYAAMILANPILYAYELVDPEAFRKYAPAPLPGQIALTKKKE